MNKIVEHTDGKVYEVNASPSERSFATIRHLIPRRASGLIARWLEEQAGQEQYTYDICYLDDDALMTVTLELGSGFSAARAWRHLYEWAYLKSRQQAQEAR